MIGSYREILEVRTRITEILGWCQLEISAGDSGAWDNSIDIQSIVDDEPQTITPVALHEPNVISPLLSLLAEPPAFHGRLSDLEYSPSQSVGDARSLQEGADPLICQLSQSLPLCGTSSSANDESLVQDFIPQHGTYFEGQTMSGSSAGCNQQLPLPVAQTEG
ncbi:hypothetical protein DEU56DRAFT_916034 [Suillus clintonianus]|uniref:uncharacterized protein n=1 Tax=Suillus clintonianus TaxID=1904413 RepID=UPI001B85B778|nr:uncharacterized protein DEU56DRAFT_916034 [Suillus clintonianus]KAG2126517.1 hypothetical protein DEU56DRAFT_916034 [Suillus clintonianus]